MDINPIEATVTEAEAAITDLVLPLEGLADNKRLNVLDPTKEAVALREGNLTRRKTRLEQVKKDALTLKASMQALFDDGYPGVVNLDVSESVTQDLDEQIASLMAARAGFTGVAPSTQVHGVVGPERPTS